VLGGGNVSDYATDNSSIGLAYTERYGGSRGGYGRPGQPPGKFTFQSEYGGRGGTGSPGMETFFSPGWGGSGRASRGRYLAWRRQLDEDRAQLDAANANPIKVDGSGKITVDVNAPKGTKVGAEGGGLFKDVEVNRQVQMEPAAGGPPEGSAY
jgi:hypothetical protein